MWESEELRYPPLPEEPINQELQGLVLIVREMLKFLFREPPSGRKNTYVSAYHLVLDMLGGLQPNDPKGNAEKMERANALLGAAMARM